MILHVVIFSILFVGNGFSNVPSAHYEHKITELLKAYKKEIGDWINQNILEKDQPVALEVHSLWVKKMTKIEKFGIFHQNIAAHAFSRGIQEHLKKKYLSTCMPKYLLNNRPNIRYAFNKFLHHNNNITWPYARYLSHRISQFIKAVGITKETFLDLQAESYTVSSKFINNYNDYCMKNLNSVQCEILMESATTVDFRIKNILMSINREWTEREKVNKVYRK